MPNTAVRAAAEGMPSLTLNRRRLLLGLAAASTTAAGVTIEAVAAPSENPELIRLGDELPELVNEYREAVAAYPAILAAWSKRWPKAPVAIHIGAGDWGWGECEKGLDGVSLTFPNKWGHECARSIWTVASLNRQIDHWHITHRRARSQWRRDETLAERDRYAALRPIARRYENACERVRTASGIRAAGARREVALKAVIANITSSLREEAATMAGVLIQAQAMQAASDHLHFGDVFVAERRDKAHFGALLAASLLKFAGGVA